MNISNDILNTGLSLSMEFGKNWLQPIDERLLEKFKNLTPTKLKECNKICKEVNQCANDFVFYFPVEGKAELNFVDFEIFKKFMLEKYHWISEANLNQLYSQSCYYAYK